MAKHIKMVLYGEPGVGKSVFASKFPKPFFITTDGNYEWLTDFGAKEEDHIRVSSWSEAKKAFKQNFDAYETVVVDLTEDLFKWCEQDYCTKEGILHLSDVGFGKGYDITRNDFFLEICKLINLDKHIIFIMHGYSTTEKDRKGIEKTIYRPTNRIPDKVLDMIEGRVRYFLRCYLQDEIDEKGNIIKKRYLSLIPKANELYAICRGIDESTVPHDIPLEFTNFAECIGLKDVETSKISSIDVIDIKHLEAKTITQETNSTVKPTEQPANPASSIDSTFVVTDISTATEEKPVEAKAEEKPIEEKHVETNEEKLARIRAKLSKA